MTQHQNYEIVNYSGSVCKLRNAKTAFFDYEMNVMNFYESANLYISTMIIILLPLFLCCLYYNIAFLSVALSIVLHLLAFGVAFIIPFPLLVLPLLALPLLWCCLSSVAIIMLPLFLLPYWFGSEIS